MGSFPRLLCLVCVENLVRIGKKASLILRLKKCFSTTLTLCYLKLCMVKIVLLLELDFVGYIMCLLYF